MAKSIRKPPGTQDRNNPRGMEQFLNDVYEQHRMVGTRTIDLASIAGGAQLSFTVTVNGALIDKQQTVEVGLPSNWSTSLVISSAFVSAANTVTIVVYNPTGGAIDMPSATYGVRVRP